MKKSLILILLAITFAACSSSEENSVAPSKEQSKFTTLSSSSVPDFDHVKGLLLADDYVQVSRPVSFVDPNGFLNYSKVEFFSKTGGSPDVWALYSWDESNLPGSPNNPNFGGQCNKIYKEVYLANGRTTITCSGNGTDCYTEKLYDDDCNEIGVVITKCECI